MRLIDADALLKKKDIITIWHDGNRASVVGIVYEDDIEEAPTVDAVPKQELFDLFDRITTAWNGKQRFFPQEDGTIYDRNMCDYIKSFEDAVNRFCNELSDW